MSEWRDIPGYEGLYQVSRDGRVKSLERKITTGRGFRILPEKILVNSYGTQINLYKNSSQKSFNIRDLVNDVFGITENIADIDGEIWKDVKYYEGLYRVSNYGRIKSIERKMNAKIRNDGTRSYSKVREKILLETTDKDGYLKTALTKERKSTDFRISRLVAEAFIPNPGNLPVVHHIDENRRNNHVSNLKWVTWKENYHASDVGGKLAKIHGKPITCNDLYGNILAEYPSAQEAARQLGIDVRHISAVVNGKRKHTRGYVFKRKVKLC